MLSQIIFAIQANKIPTNGDSKETGINHTKRLRWVLILPPATISRYVFSQLMAELKIFEGLTFFVFLVVILITS